VKRHRFDPLSFLLGVALLVVSLTFLLSGDFPTIRPSRIWPLTLIAVGVTLAVWAIATATRRMRPSPTAEAENASAVPGGQRSSGESTTRDAFPEGRQPR
jgi:hypothetical protein